MDKHARQMIFETSSIKAGKVSMNGRKMTWQCIHIFDATNENDLEVAIEVLRKGTHIDKGEEDRSDRTGANLRMRAAS